MSGRRVGKKRSDRRWEDENGAWASQLEAVVYKYLLTVPGIRVRRCEQGSSDTFDYTTPVRAGSCRACGAGDIVQRRTYTPDFHITRAAAGDTGRGFYLETKGYFSGPDRALFRQVIKQYSTTDLRILYERNGRATRRLNIGEYTETYFKIPWHVWDGRLPRSWFE